MNVDPSGYWWKKTFNRIKKAYHAIRQSVIGKALDLVFNGIKLIVGSRKVMIIWKFLTEAHFIAAWKGVFRAIWMNWKYVLATAITFITIGATVRYAAKHW